MIFHAFLIKYAEIAIKGKNRYLFEDALVKQMNIALSKIEGDYRVVKEQGLSLIHIYISMMLSVRQPRMLVRLQALM